MTIRQIETNQNKLTHITLNIIIRTSFMIKRRRSRRLSVCERWTDLGQALERMQQIVCSFSEGWEHWAQTRVCVCVKTMNYICHFSVQLVQERLAHLLLRPEVSSFGRACRNVRKRQTVKRLQILETGYNRSVWFGTRFMILPCFGFGLNRFQ